MGLDGFRYLTHWVTLTSFKSCQLYPLVPNLSRHNDQFVLDFLMIAPMAIIVGEGREGGPQMSVAQGDQATQTLFLDGANKSFGISVALGNARRTEDDFHTGGFERAPEVVNIFRIAVDDPVGFPQGEAVHGVNQLTGDLSHPLRIGRDRRAAHVDGAGPQFDDEQGVIADQPAPGQYLRREEVSRDQGSPMALQKLVPTCGLAAERSGLRSIAEADVVDGRIAHLESQIGQRTRSEEHTSELQSLRH